MYGVKGGLTEIYSGGQFHCGKKINIVGGLVAGGRGRKGSLLLILL